MFPVVRNCFASEGGGSVLVKNLSWIMFGAPFALFATSAKAQTVEDDALTLDFELELRHDSNVANAGAARAAARNLVQAEQIVSPLATFTLKRNLGSHKLELRAAGGYDFHSRNKRLNSERINVDGAGTVQVYPCRISPEVGYARRQSTLGDQLFLADPTADFENIQSEQSYSADLACGATVGVSAFGGIGYTKGDNSNPLRQRSNHEAWTYRAGVGYSQPSIGDLTLYVSEQKTDFPARALSGEPDAYKVRRYATSFARDIGARLSGSFGLSYIDVDSRSQIGSDFRGLGYTADLKLVVSPRMRLRTAISQDVKTALNNDALYTRTGSYALSADYAVNEKLAFDATYRVEDRRYVYSTTLPPISNQALLDDNFHTITANANFRLNRRVGISVFGGYERRNANGSFFDYDGFFMGLVTRIALER